MDKEITQVTSVSNDREKILQKKLEETMELYRQEKVGSAGMKSMIMEKDNIIE